MVIQTAEQQVSPTGNGTPAAAGAAGPGQLDTMPSAVSSNGEYLDPVLSQSQRRDEFDEVQGTRLGQGAKFFRADDLRDDHGRLLPAAGIVLGGPVAQAAGASRRAVSVQVRALNVTTGWGMAKAVGRCVITQQCWTCLIGADYDLCRRTFE